MLVNCVHCRINVIEVHELQIPIQKRQWVKITIKGSFQQSLSVCPRVLNTLMGIETNNLSLHFKLTENRVSVAVKKSEMFGFVYMVHSQNKGLA